MTKYKTAANRLGLKIWKKLRTWDIPMDRLLRGGEHGLSASQYARHTGDIMRPSTLIVNGPHVNLLKQYSEQGNAVFEPKTFRQTPYFANARQSMDVVGRYFTFTSEDDIVKIARQFISEFEGANVRESPYPFSGSHALAIVRPVAYSNMYEVIDGNHRLAIAHMKGVKSHRAVVRRVSAVTPVQQLLLDVGWNPNRREVYQPIDCPEIGDPWRLVRQCTDRLELMDRFLKEQNQVFDEPKTYFDVACNYGWFVRQMEKRGFQSRGVEIDYAAVELGKAAYELRPGQVTRREVVGYLEESSEQYDVVSCFSLLHHFVLGKARISAEEMMQHLDKMTKKILFFDTGQAHEAWFHKQLQDWTSDFIARWIREHSSFSKVQPLGVDRDNVPPFQDNYRRTLFACTRDDS